MLNLGVACPIHGSRSKHQNVNIWNRLLSAACNTHDLLVTPSRHISVVFTQQCLCFFFYVACFSHIFFGIFFFCTLKVCKLRRRRRIKYPNLHCSRGVWVCDCVRAVQSSDWGRYLSWDFLLLFFFQKWRQFVVLCSLALWTCCYSFKWPRMVIDCMFVFLPFTYILRIYWSYLCFTNLMWCVCVCVCVKLHTLVWLFSCHLLV